jgi:TonB family protein
MSTTQQNPPEAPRFFPRPPEHPDRQRESVEYNPVILNQLQDELARSRLREAFWISVIFHLLVIASVLLGPKFVPSWATWGKPVHVKTAEELLREKDLTFLQLPLDEQKLTERPKQSKFISDKDRVATSRTPQLDKKALEMLRKAQRPGMQAPPTPQNQPGQQAQQLPPPNPGAPSQQAPPPTVANNNTSNFNYPTPERKPNPFNVPMSPGTSINEAARATAMGSGARGGGGDIGFGGGGAGRVGNIDILSDTQGVDFGPYLARVLQSVRLNWYNLIPEVARPPLLERGKVKIEFAITKDGKVAGMRLIGPSGDVALDRAAWGGITASNPFPPLPNEFRGPYLALRFHFLYNPDRRELE